MTSLPGPDTITRHVLPNGIVVLIHEYHNSPSLALRGHLWTGGLDDPLGKDGLASFTADCLTRGAGQRSMAELYEATESIGAALDIESGRQLTGFAGKCLVEDARFILGLLGDLLRRPTFPAVEVERERGEYLTALEMREHDTRAQADMALRAMLYRDHPYSRIMDGTLESVRGLTRKDVIKFHRKYYAPLGMTISLVGAVNTAEALGWVEEVFGDWQTTRPARVALPPVPATLKGERRHIALPGKIQTDLMLGYIGPARDADDFMAARMANTILGVFGMMGRLGRSVRDTQGLAYYSTSRLEGGLGAGPWVMLAGVNPTNVTRAIDGIVAELRRMCDTLVPEEELADNKAFLTGGMPLSLETNDSLARIILDLELYQLGLDYLRRYKEMIHAITAEELRTAMQHYIDPDGYVLASSGPALV